MEFYKKLVPARKENMLGKPGWFLWGASVCWFRDKYYIFISGWKEEYKFSGWIRHSTILRGVGLHPEGPFTLTGEMIELKNQAWSAEVLHNPTVCQINDKFYLFYIGSCYKLDDNTKELPNENEVYRYNQRIGVAMADDPSGEFIPYEGNPVLDRSCKGWDDTFVTNPAVCAEDGVVHLIYKSLIRQSMPDIVLKLGIAKAARPEGVYAKMGDGPLLSYNVEDPFVWKQDGKYYMIAKDMTGDVAGRPDYAVMLESPDLLDWKLCREKLAYTTTIEFENGELRCANVERPQIYFENGKPVCLYNAVKTTEGTTFNLARRIIDE